MSTVKQEISFVKVIKATRLDRQNVKVARVILILLCAFNFSLIVVSATSNTWVESIIFDETMGLWKYCSKSICYDFDDPIVINTFNGRKITTLWLQTGEVPEWLTICRITIIISACFSFFAFLVALFGLFNRYIYGYYSSVFSVVAFSLLLVSVYLYTDKTAYFAEQLSCGVGWGLGFLAVVLTFLAGFTGFCTF